MIGTIRRTLVRVTAGLLLLTVVAGLPVALTVTIGWPLPAQVPTAANLTGWLTESISDTVIVNTLAVAAWLLWAAFLPAVATEAVAAWRGLPTRATTHRTTNPLHLAAATLITALALGTLPAAALTSSSAAAQNTSPTASPIATRALNGSTTPDSSTPLDNGTALTSGTAPNSGPLSKSSPASSTTIGGAVHAENVTRAVSGPGGVSQRGPVTVHVGATRYRYIVDRDDTLSGIAQAWLGDATRWPEICQLNWHRHWPGIGGHLNDCDLIYPGWDLKLPADATPPPTATQPPDPGTPDSPPPELSPAVPGAPLAPTSPPTSTPTSAPTATPTTNPPPVPTTTAATAPTSATAPTPAPTSVPSTAAATAPSVTSAPTRSPAPASPTATGAAPTESHSPRAATTTAGPITNSSTGSSTAHETDHETDQDSAPRSVDTDGITLPGGFLPWTLAASLAAAIALVWLQRRRRHTPTATDDDPGDLPEPLLQVHRYVARHPDLPTDPDLAERAAHVPHHTPLPPGGIGFVGDGAHAAARAALTAVLASGGPRDPDRQGEVVIDGTTLTTLIGVDAAALGPWPRLHVADDLDHALTVLEAKLLHRARLLDEHTLTDLDTLRANAPDEEPLPPILLITETPPPGARMRTSTTLALGARVDVTAVLLGPWAHGDTIHIDPDGHTTVSPPGDHPDGIPDRVAVLDADLTVAALTALREAHTGLRPSITAALPATASPPRHPDDEDSDPAPSTTPPPDGATPGPADTTTVPAPTTTDPADPDFASASAEPVPAEQKARLAVFGTPRVEDLTEPGQPLRAKAGELAALLACHPDGLDTRAIGEYLEPDVRLRHADTRTHTNVSNLRHVLGRAAGPRKLGYVIKTAGRYRLDPTTVHVDLWHLRDLLTQATTAPPADRIDLLRQACQTYTAPLAHGCDYDWVEPHRERVRQQITDAHLLLADTLTPTDPAGAAEVLDQAIHLDPYNEPLHRAAMHAHHRIGDREGVRALLRTLTVALADLDAEPDEDTIELARQLRAQTPAPQTGDASARGDQ